MRSVLQQRRGRAGLLTSLSRKTVLRQLKAVGVTAVKGRPISQARVDAVADPRNAITHAVAMEALCKGRNPALIGNMDATQFQCEIDDKSAKVLVLSKNHDVEQRMLTNSSTAFFIKYLSIYFANGYAAPPVLIIANENISPEDFKVVKVRGMSHSVEHGAYGYLVFTHTRAANQAFFKWLFLNVIFPTIEAQRMDCPISIAADATGQADAVFTLDGEQQQVYAAADHEVLAESKRTMTHILKLCASCSLIHQLCDVCAIYRNSKADMKRLIDPRHIEAVNIDLHIKTAIEPLEPILKLTSEGMKRQVDGISKVVGVLRKNVITNHIVVGAQKTSLTGVADTWDTYVRPLPFRDSTHDFTPAEMTTINSRWPEMIREFQVEGMLSDIFLDSLNMPRLITDADNGAKHINREDLVEYRWRITSLNHDTIRDTLDNRRAKKEEDDRAALERKHAAEAKKANKAVFLPLMESAKSLNSKSRRIPTLHDLRLTCEETFTKAQQFCKDIAVQWKSINDYLISGSFEEATAANAVIENLAVQVTLLSETAKSDNMRSNAEINDLTPSE
jgi:hypothetical protein